MEWISVKDKLPEDNRRVLIVYYGYVEIAEYNSTYFDQQEIWTIENRGEYMTELKPSHWQPLPSLPE